MLVVFFVMLLGCAPQLLVTPSFHVVTSNNERVHAAIKNALVNRKWAILKNEPSAIEAQYSRGSDISATIRVEHVGDLITIKYVDSSGLQYNPHSNSAHGPAIRKAYNAWVSNLERDIKVQIGAGL